MLLVHATLDLDGVTDLVLELRRIVRRSYVPDRKILL